MNISKNSKNMGAVLHLALRRSTIVVIWLVAALSMLPATQAAAASHCKVKIGRSDGVLNVYASSVAGILKWAPDQTSPPVDFYDTNSCIVSGRARACHIADPSTTAAKTPPAGCTLYISDDGAESCAVWIRGCTPGLREVATVEADVATLQADVTGLTASLAATNADVVALSGQVATLDAQLSAVGAGLAVVEDKTQCMNANATDTYFTGCNVHVRNGTGLSNSTNGSGNLIVGYDEGAGTKTGSHNLVIGPDHVYSSYGGLIAGSGNVVHGQNSSVLGGSSNVVSGPLAVVCGGDGNRAHGMSSVVGGGLSRQANGTYDWVAGSLFENQ